MRAGPGLMLGAALVLLLAAALAAGTYLGIERLGRRGLVPMFCRWVAWSALGLLLLNVSCPAPSRPRRPLVLLDASLSMAAAGGHWSAARAAAESLGEVRTFGDERAGRDTVPTRGRSMLAPALVAAAAGDRPVIVVSDGEIDDGPDLPADVRARAGVRLFPRTPAADIAVTTVQGPTRATIGDSLTFDVDLRRVGAAPDSVTVAVREGETTLARRRVPLEVATARVRLVAPSRGLAAGDHLLDVGLLGARDGEPRTDHRLHLVTLVATPGVVLLAGPADWDARFLFRTIRDVAQLPARGYVRVGPDQWRNMTDLAPVSPDVVRQAARRADLLVLKGSPGDVGRSSPRGLWVWPSGEGGEPVAAGDWYLSPGGASPLAGVFLGLPIDSFPPATQLMGVQPAPGDWVALTAQLGRRGAERPAVVGRDEGRTRRVTVAADGLWRWAFRGGSSEQAYRAWVASTVSWLLGGADSARGAARPVRPVVANGRPIAFEWAAPGAPRPLAVTLAQGNATRSDTLRFDGAGRAEVWAPVGRYRYRIAEGGQGTVAVEEYSDEWLPRPVALSPRPPGDVTRPARRAARDWLWLFAIAVVALAGEWTARRRMGLR